MNGKTPRTEIGSELLLIHRKGGYGFILPHLRLSSEQFKSRFPLSALESAPVAQWQSIDTWWTRVQHTIQAAGSDTVNNLNEQLVDMSYALIRELLNAVSRVTECADDRSVALFYSRSLKLSNSKGAGSLLYICMRATTFMRHVQGGEGDEEHRILRIQLRRG
jgi:hypothetical protein